VAASLLALSAISAAVGLAWRKYPYLLVGWLWYLGMLVPVIGLVQVGDQVRADRYTYLPQIGLYVAAACGLADVSRLWRYGRWACSCAATLVIAVLIAAAARQTSYWRDGETMWKHTLACTSNNVKGQNNLGHYLTTHNRIPEAIEHFREAIRIRPDFADALTNLAEALRRQGEPDEAVKIFRRVIEIKPDCAAAYANLGLILNQKGDTAQAIAYCRKALDIDPNIAEAYVNLGIALGAQGNVEEEIANYRKALELRPQLVVAHVNLGITLFDQGDVPEAVAQWREAIRWDPENIPLLKQTAWVLATSPDASVRNGAEALELARRAVQLSGGQDPAVLDALSAAYAELGRFPEAVQVAKQAIALAASQNNNVLAAALQARIELYQSGSPYRETQRLPPPHSGQP
jgi:tetratricopeptide (TPR) repeat protein